VDAGFSGGIVDLAVLASLAVDAADADNAPKLCAAHVIKGQFAEVVAGAEICVDDGIPHVAGSFSLGCRRG